MTSIRSILMLTAKDLRVEARTHQTAGLVIVLGLLIMTVLALGLRSDSGAHGAGAAAILWVAYLFAGVLCFERTMGIEREDDALAGLMLAQLSPGVIYTAKLLTNLVMIVGLAAVITPAGIALFGLALPPAPFELLGILALSLIGFAAVGTLFSAGLSVRRSGGVLALLVFPLALPLVIASTRQVVDLESGAGAGHGGMAVLLAFDVIFVTAGWLAFDSLLDP